MCVQYPVYCIPKITAVQQRSEHGWQIGWIKPETLKRVLWVSRFAFGINDNCYGVVFMPNAPGVAFQCGSTINHGHKNPVTIGYCSDLTLYVESNVKTKEKNTNAFPVIPLVSLQLCSVSQHKAIQYKNEIITVNRCDCI